MRVALTVVLAVHALIHLAGFFKAFGLAELPALKKPISRVMGLVWFDAAMFLVLAAVALFVWPQAFWLVALVAALVSQAAIISSWRDARFGTLANVVVLLAAGLSAFMHGPFGLRAEYDAAVTQRIAALKPLPVVEEKDLEPLPPLVQRYLRFVGVVGQPRVAGFRARFHGRIRSAADAEWMTFTGEQHNFVNPPTRLFWMDATMKGLPVDALHAYADDGARMRVKALSVVPVVDASGADFTKTETVTLFNDLCVMAPAALIDPAIGWKTLDEHSVEATFSAGPHTIHAVLVFDETGALVNFWSDDRPALAPDNVTFVPQRWSTPLREYGQQGPVKLATRGEARYAAKSGDYSYIEFDSLEVTYDLTR